MLVKNVVTGEGDWGRCPQNGDIEVEMEGSKGQISKEVGEQEEYSGLREWSLKALGWRAESVSRNLWEVNVPEGGGIKNLLLSVKCSGVPGA